MAAPAQKPTGSEFEQDFLKILNNARKYETSSSEPPRTKGFVVLVRGGNNLKPLQDLCLDPDRQTHNWCFTARYRLPPKMVIGTLMASWLSDVTKMTRGQKDLVGDLRFGGAGAWNDDTGRKLLAKLSDHPPLSFPAGTLTSDFFKTTSSYFSKEGIIQMGQRVVLFAELSEPFTDSMAWAREWVTASGMLLDNLPERMGVVVSGVPESFRLFSDDPPLLNIEVPKDYGGAVQGTLAYKYTDSSFHSDVPAEKDELGVNDYANAIARFVLHPQTNPPITIGIHGPWGKGKSSFMQLIDSALVKYAEVNRAGNTQKWNDLATRLAQIESIQAAAGSAEVSDEEKKRQKIQHDKIQDEERAAWGEMTEAARRNVLRVRFNAWQFEDAKQTWAGLASEISEQMEALLPRRARLFLKLKYAWKERKSELILNILLPITIFIVVTVLYALGLIIPNPGSSVVRVSIPIVGMLATIWIVTSQFVKVAQPISERVLSYVAMPNYREQMGFQHQVKDDLKFVYEYLSTWLNTSSFNRAGKFRLVVYIDDLDRCSENKIMELLQAINLILADCEFFVFVGMDTQMIYRAIKAYYSNSAQVDDAFADNYLSKIIQISFHLPDSKLQKRTQYLSTLFSLSSRLEFAGRAKTNGHGVAPKPVTSPTTPVEGALPYDVSQVLKIVPVQIKETEDTAEELAAFTDYCDFIDDNPREIKRLINIHRLIKILVQKPDTTLDPIRQKKLVKWLIFCDTWPQLVGRILEDTKSAFSENCLLALTNRLADELNNPASTEAVPNFDRLDEFAVFPPSLSEIEKQGLSESEIAERNQRRDEDRAAYSLSAADIDDDFRLAARLSLMIRKPAHRTQPPAPS